jgi:hypothetical protein
MSEWVDDPTFKMDSADSDWVDDPTFQQGPPSKLESGLRGLAQGASLGFADEISGGVEALLSDKTYEQARNESRANFKRAKDSNPKTFTAGEIGGTIATSLIPGVGAAGTAGKLALTGAAVGGLSGLGNSEADSIGGMAIDTGLGAGLGAGAGYLGAKVAPWAADKVGKGLKGFAETRAFKALGGLKKANEEAMKKGNLKSIGRQMLDEGVVTPLASKETMAGRVSDLVRRQADSLDEELSAVLTGKGIGPEQKLILEKAKFSPKEAAEILKSQIRAQYSELPEKVLNSRLQLVDDWLSKPGSMNIKQAQNFKTQMQKFINDKSYWKENPNASQETLMGIRRAVKEGIEDNADAYAFAAGKDGGTIKNINQQLGNSLQADDILADRLSRDASNRSLSLTDYLAGIAGNAGGGPIGMVKGMAAAGANKLGREYGNNVMAVGADKVSKVLLQSPKFAALAKQNPAAFAALAEKMSQKMNIPQALRQTAGQEHISPREAQDQFLEGN